MQLTRLNVLLASTLSAGMLTASSLSAAPYELVDLGTLGGVEAYALAINASNQITGASDGPEIPADDVSEENPATQCPIGNVVTFREFCRHGFLYTGGTMIDLGDIGFFTSYTYDLNDSGIAVGNSFIDNDQGDDDDTNDTIDEYGVVSVNGAPMEALPLNADVVAAETALQQRALAINNLNQIVGYMLYPNPTTDLNGDPTTIDRIRGYIYDFDNSTYTMVPAFEDDADLQTSIRGINEAGVVVGWGVANDEFDPSRALVWDSNSTEPQATDLGTLGGYFSYANDINNNNIIVGRADTSTVFGENNNLAYYYDMNAATPEMVAVPEFSDNPDFTTSVAFGINDLDQIVGSAQISAGFTPVNTAFLYDITTQTLTNLNDMVECELNWELNIAYDINNSGVITGVGTLNGIARAYMLVPTGETEPTNCTDLRNEEREQERDDAQDSAGGGGSTGFFWLMLGSLVLMRRRKQ